jgi:intracellular multiplication protein IcmC
MNFATIMQSLAGNLDTVIQMTLAIAYVAGFWFIISALAELRKVGQAQAGHAGSGGIIARFFLGVLLIYYPSTINIATATLWGTNSLIAYIPSSTDSYFGTIKYGAYKLIQMLGYISFVRGFLILNGATKSGAQQGTISKGAMHVVGGILAINIVTFVQVILNTLGMGSN